MARFRGTPVSPQAPNPPAPRFKGAPVEGPSVLGDVIASTGAGLRGGVEGTMALPGLLTDVQGRAFSGLAGLLGAGDETKESAKQLGEALSPMNWPAKLAGVFSGEDANMPSLSETEKITDTAIGEGTLRHTPETTIGRYAKAGAEFLPAAVGGPGGIGRRVITQALLPSVGSETAGHAAEGTGYESYARIIGALLGGMSPSALKSVVSPFSSSPERQALVKYLENEGVELTAGQKTGSEKLRYLESELGGHAGQQIAENQGRQFTKAALERAGVKGDSVAPATIDAAFTKLGKTFDTLGSRNTLLPDPKMGQDLMRVINDYRALVPPTTRAPGVEKMVGDIVATLKQHHGIPGDSYQALRSRLETMARGSKDPHLSEALRGIRTSLDDAMERSIGANNPSDLGAWKEVRQQYKNLLVLEKAATGAGEKTAQGLVSPSQLRNATVQQGRRAYARGKGDFAKLARAGEAVMKPLPNSGTAPRLWAQNIASGPMSIAGALAGAHTGDMTNAVVGAVLGNLAGKTTQAALAKALMSKGGQRYLANQVGSGLPGADPRAAAIIAALMGPNSGPPR